MASPVYTRVHEFGFSRSECLELARRMDACGTLTSEDIKCDQWNCNGRINSEHGLSPRERATIVAALRAYAG